MFSTRFVTRRIRKCKNRLGRYYNIWPNVKKLNILGKKSSLFIRKPTEKFQRNNTDTKNDSYVSVQLPTKEHAVWSPINQTTINFQEKFEIKKKPLHRVSIENNVYSKLRKINSNKILIRSLLIS